jgi:U3 small nucleolar RNA-associated protein 3
MQSVDAELEPSDEEVLAYSDSDDEDEAHDQMNAESEEEEQVEDEDEDAEGWGTSKKDYYNNDEIQTEADALEEEAEALRLQKKKLQKMSEADFGLDDILDWMEPTEKDEELEKGDTVTEVLKEIEVTPDMKPEERYRILQTRYPEFDHIADEFLKLHPVLEDLQEKLKAEESSGPITSRTSPTLVKCRALVAYMATMGMYFALFTSPARDKGECRALDPADLHDHPVMEYLVATRQTWEKAKSVKAHAIDKSKNQKKEDESVFEPIVVKERGEALSSKRSRKEGARLDAAEAAAAKRAQQIKETEEQLANLSNLVSKPRKASAKSKSVMVEDDNSDFGEEESMDAKSAADKAQKKKSLRFYTSQIAQKANKRADAGRDAGGDADLPHRERLRDRQARLNIEAEKRGKKLDEYGRGGAGAALGGDSDSGDDAIAEQVRDEGDEYYDMVAQLSKKKKADKQERMDAIKQAKAEGAMVRVVEGEVDEDGKRAIGYVIEKNKGLAPKRKKDVRNPRVKKRKKYEEKKKKLASTKAVYKGGEERGGYGGEKTGIKTGLVKSIKL